MTWDPVTDQQLADRVHRATEELNEAKRAALDAGLEVSVATFSGQPRDDFVAHIQRVIPRVVTTYRPSFDTPADHADDEVETDDSSRDYVVAQIGKRIADNVRKAKGKPYRLEPPATTDAEAPLAEPDAVQRDGWEPTHKDGKPNTGSWI